MNITLLEDVWEIENERTAVEMAFLRIYGHIQEEDLYLSHVKVDGIDVYDDYIEYIVDHLEECKNVDIHVMTAKEFYDDLLLSMNGYLERVVPQIGMVADEFYKASDEAWVSLEQLLEGMQWIVQVIDTLLKKRASYSGIESFARIATNLNVELPQLMEALQDHDTTAIGDLLQYEVKPQLEELEEEVKRTIDNEIVRDDVN